MLQPLNPSTPAVCKFAAGETGKGKQGRNTPIGEMHHKKWKLAQILAVMRQFSNFINFMAVVSTESICSVVCA